MALTREGFIYRLPTGPWTAEDQPALEVSGRARWRALAVPAEGRGPGKVAEGYRERLSGLGFDILFDCRAEACGGFDFRHRVALLPAPEMLVDAGTMIQLSARRETGEGAQIASVLVSRVLDRIHVQTVVMAERRQPAALAPSGEAPEGEDATLPGDAAALRERLEARGHVPVLGLSFETGGTRLTPASEPALDLLARILREDPELAVVIVGHTDNEGSLEINLGLSRRRAGAVREALVARGVPGDQLTAEGVGFLAPRTSNATPEGRARNRRVELVLP